MADGQGGRPWWQWILIALLIIGIIYLIFSLFALGRNQSRIGFPTPTPTGGAEETEELTPTTEASPTEEPTRKPATTTPTRPPLTATPSPTGAIQQTPQTGS
jgi:cytoskeletal protein RodZ